MHRSRPADTIRPSPEPQADHPPASGILPCQQLERLSSIGAIRADEPIADRQIQPASVDLRLGAVGYRLRASFLPGRDATVEARLGELAMAEINLATPTILEKRCVYLVKLMEHLELPIGCSAKANPKSTTGRLDVFTRLVTDGGTEFDRAKNTYRGPLYAEIVPRTFSVVVQKGLSLSQLRIIASLGPSVPDDEHPGAKLTVNLQGSDESPVVAYRGRANAPLVDMRLIDAHHPDPYWTAITEVPESRLILDPGDFYILGSQEGIIVPPAWAAEMTPFDPAMGEFRIHYAGFFDPGFGYSNERGTRAVLEVRAHEVPFAIEHGQVVGRIGYRRLLEPPDRIYGAAIGSSYQGQGLALSKQFRKSANDGENT